MNAKNPVLKAPLIFTMGVRYSKLYSAVNSLAWLRGTVPYSQKFVIARFIIAGANCRRHWLGQEHTVPVCIVIGNLRDLSLAMVLCVA